MTDKVEKKRFMPFISREERKEANYEYVGTISGRGGRSEEFVGLYGIDFKRPSLKHVNEEIEKFQQMRKAEKERGREYAWGWETSRQHDIAEELRTAREEGYRRVLDGFKFGIWLAQYTPKEPGLELDIYEHYFTTPELSHRNRLKTEAKGFRKEVGLVLSDLLLTGHDIGLVDRSE